MASLIENVEREALNPADEFTAFARLIDAGRSVEDVAAVFGVTPQVVKRRLKLAAVSPALLTLFREGGIGLDCLMVLASIDDPARQEELWQQLPEWNRSAEQLRRMLTRGEVESDRDGLAIFVTVPAYEAAGGPVRRDLFSDDGKAYLQDAALLERLALDKLQEPAREVAAEGWKWIDVRARYVYEDYVRHGEVRRSTPRTERRRGGAPCATRSRARIAACAHGGASRTKTATRTSTPRWKPNDGTAAGRTERPRRGAGGVPAGPDGAGRLCGVRGTQRHGRGQARAGPAGGSRCARAGGEAIHQRRTDHRLRAGQPAQGRRSRRAFREADAQPDRAPRRGDPGRTAVAAGRGPGRDDSASGRASCSRTASVATGAATKG